MDKLIITGASGFIGKELMKKLSSQRKYEIHAIERYVTGRYLFERGSDAIMHYANITDYNKVRQIVREVQPNYVINLAAISAVSFSYGNFIEVLETDFLGTAALAEACRTDAHDLRQFIHAGTSEEYGMELHDRKLKLTEESALKPNSPYAVAKTSAELYLRYMRMAFGFPYTILRPFNTFGRGPSNTHFFIERTISQMLERPNEEVTLGDPDAVRDWLYVSDHVEGYLKALGNPKALGETIQLCTGVGYTTRETAEIIGKIIGFKGTVAWKSTPQRPLDAECLIGDNEKAAKLLGWKPQYTLEQGLREAIGKWSILE